MATTSAVKSPFVISLAHFSFGCRAKGRVDGLTVEEAVEASKSSLDGEGISVFTAVVPS